MDRSYLLLRYLEEKGFAEQFMEGHIRLNSLEYFWGEHDEPTKTGQIDMHEGIVCDITATKRDECYRFDGYKYCNLLCCCRLEYVISGETIGWYNNRAMGDFGDFVVVIRDPDEFRRRLVHAAETDKFMCGCSSVDYSGAISPDRDCFVKEPEYLYQKEWRAVLNRGVHECEPCELFIGPIYDIAEMCYTAELGRTLSRIFHERDFRIADDSYYGNVDRIALRGTA